MSDDPILYGIDERPEGEIAHDLNDADAHGDGAGEAVATGTEAVRQWRVAEALLQLRAQVNAAFPKRNRASDGTIGDLAHQGRGSDHNPWVVDRGIGVVTGMDITHDPAGGCDAGKLIEAIRGARDPRIKYVIWNKRIANAAPIGGAPAWAWRAYGGRNPHDHHCHLSVKPEKASYDSKAAWTIRSATEATEASDTIREIRYALSALGAGAERGDLRAAIADARDAAEVLLARYDAADGDA